LTFELYTRRFTCPLTVTHWSAGHDSDPTRSCTHNLSISPML